MKTKWTFWDLMPWEKHSITYIEFFSGIHNLNLIMSKYQKTQNKEHSIFKKGSII